MLRALSVTLALTMDDKQVVLINCSGLGNSRGRCKVDGAQLSAPADAP
jgi:hypothetical protein